MYKLNYCVIINLSNPQRLKVVNLYYCNKLEKRRGRFAELNRLPAVNGIKINRNNARLLIKKLQQTGSISTLVSRNLTNT